MKKAVLMLVAAMVFVWQGPSFAASTVDALIQKLEDKGILTTEEANQVKDEVSSEEQSSQQATFKSMLPDWLNGLKVSGDFRFRTQTNYRKVPLTSSTSDNFHQTRERIRARLNFEDQVNDYFKMVVGIATDGGTPRSNNYTLGGQTTKTGITNLDNFGKPDIILNKAYGVFTPTKDVKLLFGKMDNPIWEAGGASFLWDPDITTEGGALLVEHKLNDYLTPFAQVDILDMHDLAPTSSVRTDPYLLFLQGGIKGNLTDKIYFKGAFDWYAYNNPSRFIDTALSTGTNTTVTGGTTYLLYNFNNIMGGSVEVGMNDPLGSFGEMLPSFLYVPQFGVFGDYMQNNGTGMAQNKAWLGGAYIGNSALNGWGTWKLSALYKVIERDAWLDTLPNDDFYSGDTDTAGWQSEIDIGLTKNVWFDMLYYRTHVFKHISTINALSQTAPEDVFQMDLNIKF